MDPVYSFHDTFPVGRYSIYCIKHIDKDFIAFQTVEYTDHAEQCMCRSVQFGQKKLLLVDFPPLALYKTISIHFILKVILGKLSTCTITSLIILPQTMAYIIHAKLCISRSVHIYAKNYYELIFRLWLYIKQFLFIFSTK